MGVGRTYVGRDGASACNLAFQLMQRATSGTWARGVGEPTLPGVVEAPRVEPPVAASCCIGGGTGSETEEAVPCTENIFRLGKCTAPDPPDSADAAVEGVGFKPKPELKAVRCEDNSS